MPRTSSESDFFRPLGSGAASTERKRAGRKMFLRSNIVLRVVGLMLGFVAMLPSFISSRLPWWGWAAVVGHGLVWPLVSSWRLTRADDIVRTERGQLQGDHLLCGVWVGAIGLAPLPSAVTYAFMAMDSMILGGWRLAARGTALHLAGAVLGLTIFGWRFVSETTLWNVLACLPVLLIYPLTVGLLSNMTLQALGRQRQQMRELIDRDPLSSLYNRRVWDKYVAEMWSQRDRHACTLVMADIDHFKDVNDQWGHGVGDEAIRRFAQHLRDTLRSSDLLCRYGGEEFAILMPRASEQEARAAMQRVRVLLQEQPLVDGVVVTASFGVAALDPRLPDAHAWIARADAMLYEAKRRGRDRIELASDPENLRGDEVPPDEGAARRTVPAALDDSPRAPIGA